MKIKIPNSNIAIGKNQPVFTIADIGKNFIQEEESKSLEEYLTRAKELIKAVKDSGADAVKFQTHNLEDEQLNINVTSPHFSGSDRYNWVKRNDETTPIEFWQELKKYCDQIGIIFFSTPMSRGAAEKLDRVGMPFWKVGSADILDFAMFDFMASTDKPIIISFGMSDLKETDKAVEFLKKRTEKIVLMHCVSVYPCPPEKLNLGTIEFLKKRYNLPVGFSSHSTEWQSSVAAANLGAIVIEKHFTFDRNSWGPDHKVSLLPNEFKAMVEHLKKGTRFDTKNYGRQSKLLNEEEIKFRPLFRKSLMAGQDIQAGEKLTKDKIYAMRPQAYANGLPSEEYEKILDKEVRRDMKKFEPINWQDLKGAKKRKICVVITSKIHYSRSKLILEELKNHEDIELQILVGGSAILEKYGNILPLLEEDGFDYNAKIVNTLEGGDPLAMAKTSGLGIIEFASAFDNFKPDLVLLRGDRYEILSAAIAAAYLNIPIAHIEGGDVTGTIDESVRHAITKLSHIHFTTNPAAKNRVVKMGEDPKYVFDFGSPELEFVTKNNYQVTNELINQLGVGDTIDINQPFLMVMQHPVTSEISQNRKNVETTLEAVHELGIPTIWFWPNIDAGTDEVSKGIRVFREHVNSSYIRFIKSLPAEEFIGLLKQAACLVGNSSAGIKECSALGIPVVNIGTRQQGRLRAENVMDVGYNKEEIKKAILDQVKYGKYPPSHIYYKPDTANNIVKTLADIELYVQKKFCD